MTDGRRSANGSATHATASPNTTGRGASSGHRANAAPRTRRPAANPSHAPREYVAARQKVRPKVTMRRPALSARSCAMNARQSAIGIKAVRYPPMRLGCPKGPSARPGYEFATGRSSGRKCCTIPSVATGIATSTSKKAIPRRRPIPRTLVMAARNSPVIANRFSMASRLLPLWIESTAEIADASRNRNSARVARASHTVRVDVLTD